MKKLFIILAFFVSIMLFSVGVYAIGVAQEYLNDNTLYLAPGTSRLFTITLQNGDSDDIKVRIVLDSEIATITDALEIYTIPAKFYDMFIRLNITVPKDANIGAIYPISYYVQPITEADGSMIPINLRINKHFNVKVVDENQQTEQKAPPRPNPVANKPKQEIIEEPAIISKNDAISKERVFLNRYFQVGLILCVIVLVILFLWKKSALLSTRLIKKSKIRRKKR